MRYHAQRCSCHVGANSYWISACAGFRRMPAACRRQRPTSRFILRQFDADAHNALAAVDMNHIIHAVTHPSWRLEPYANDEEMFREIEAYLDLIVSEAKCVADSVLLRNRLDLPQYEQRLR